VTNARVVGLALGAAAALAMADARQAEARILDLHLGADAGGITGWGSTPNTPDFFQHTRGAGLGFDVGVKLLVFDLSARFTQVFNGSGTAGTLTQFLLGFVIDIPIGEATIGEDAPPPPPPPPPPPQQGAWGEGAAPRPPPPSQQGAWGEGGQPAPANPPPPPPPAPRRRTNQVLRPGIAAGFGFGTPGPVNPPLSNDQISDKGIVTEARLEYEYFLSPFLALGAKGLVGYHYFLGGAAINASEGHSQGYSLAGFGTLTFHIGF
jgi:hypothetical protein